MLTFEQITLNTLVQSFQQSHQKLIRFSYNTVSSVSPENGLVMQDNKIRWNKNFTFPAVYGKEIAFEVFEKHRFGYNPQEFNVIKGCFMLSKGQTFKQVDVTDSNGSKLGKIQFKLRSNSIIPVKIQKIMPKNQKLIIKSLTAHIKSLSGKKSYISIKLGDIHKQTPVIKSHGGQIVYTEPIEMEKSSFINKALIQIFVLEDKGNQVKTVGNGVLQIDAGMVERSVIIKDEKDAEVGKLFVNGRIVEKGKINFQKTRQSRYSTVDVNKHSSINPQKYSIINIQRLNSFRQPPTQQSRISSFRGGLSVQLPRNSSQSSNIMSSSRLSVSRMKKMTILNDNKEIVFPKQQRFKLYQDRQSPFISYLNQRDDFLYKQKHSGRFYRGVAIGYGDKTDFAQKGSPGVGRYKLPSIWDRY